MRPRRITPGPGQESVWDYPRPPRVEDDDRHIQVVFGGVTIADTRRAKRVLETSHPPVYYIPPADISHEYMQGARGSSYCEFKGEASYVSVVVGDRRVQNAGWYYATPSPGFEELKGYVAFYPSLIDACYVDGERVRAQEGDFYGGWITDQIVGPFKGAPGTWGW